MSDQTQGTRLAGKVAVVTGGASGIGRASALRFAEEGARVAIWDLYKDGIDETVDELVRDAGGAAHGVQVDIADTASVAAAAEGTVRTLGDVTVVMNNAGVLDDYAPALDTTDELWDRVVGVNLKGMFLVSRALLPSMITAGGGSIVNTASVSALIAGGGGIAYTTSKHGVIGLPSKWPSTTRSKVFESTPSHPGRSRQG